MEEKYQAVEEILKKHGQEQLLNHFEKLSEEKKAKLLDQILTIDFNQIKELYQEIGKKIDKQEQKIEPIEYVEKAKLNEEEYKKYEQLGINVIKENKLAVVTMAGGQGTRLGHNGPKGTYNLGIEPFNSIFEILCNTLKEAYKKYGVYVNWYIMTSNENNGQTVDFFEKNDYFGYPKNKISFFKQGQLPMIDTNGKVLIGEDGLVKEAADGHGGIFDSMSKNGVIYDMKTKGIEWVFISGVDNILVNMVDPILIGLTINNNLKVAGTSTVKAYPHEKVGIYCKKNGKPSIVEYSEISKEMAEETNKDGELVFAESNLLCNLFRLDAIEDISKNKLPYHSAFKKAKYIDEKGNLIVSDKPNAYKFEAFLFDAFESLENMLILRVKREEEFAPVKNAEGVDSPETARTLYEKKYKRN